MTVMVGDAVQVVMTWVGFGSEIAQNVWHMEMISGAGAAPADILTAIRTQVRVAFAAFPANVSDHWSITQYDLLQRDKVLHQWDGVSTLGETTLVGTNAADFLPHGVAHILRYSTGLSRRQGRMFKPASPDSNVVDGVFIAGAQTALLAFGAIWDTDISVTGGLLQLCTFNVEPLSVHFETASLADGNLIANEIPGYQRRRKPGVGV